MFSRIRSSTWSFWFLFIMGLAVARFYLAGVFSCGNQGTVQSDSRCPFFPARLTLCLEWIGREVRYCEKLSSFRSEEDRVRMLALFGKQAEYKGVWHDPESQRVPVLAAPADTLLPIRRVHYLKR
jgi:hypothetical protein